MTSLCGLRAVRGGSERAGWLQWQVEVRFEALPGRRTEGAHTVAIL